MGRSRLEYRKKHKGTLSKNSRKEIAEYHRKEKLEKEKEKEKESNINSSTENLNSSKSFDIKDEEFEYSNMISFKDELLPIETYDYGKYIVKPENQDQYYPIRLLTQSDLNIISESLSYIPLTEQLNTKSNIDEELNTNYNEINRKEEESALELNIDLDEDISETNSIEETTDSISKTESNEHLFLNQEDPFSIPTLHTQTPFDIENHPIIENNRINNINKENNLSHNTTINQNTQENNEELEEWLDSIL